MLKERKNIDFFFCISIIVLVLFSGFYPSKIRYYPAYIDWETISLLTGLFIITTGLKMSNFFYSVSKRMVKRVRYESTLAFLLVSISAVFSMFLTNDISILIVVPLTLSLSEIIKNDTGKLIILEIIAVNVGSLLSPIGNPQNIYIWHKWHVPFFEFILKMFPLFAALFLLLFIFTFVMSKKKSLLFHAVNNNVKTDRKLLFVSFVSFIVFIVSEELHAALYVLPVIFLVYLIFFREVLKKTNWSLVILFAVLFIDIHMLSDLSLIDKLLCSFKLNNVYNLYSSGILLSQMISNVPATLLLADYNVNWMVLAYAVNIGGSGIVTGSLANLIALRLVDSKNIFMRFHKYSFLYLLLSAGIGIFLLSCMPLTYA